MTYLKMCELLLLMAFSATCPQPGEPVPETLVPIILYAGGWPAEYMDEAMHIVMRETYHHTDENGVRYIYPWSEPNWGNYENGARGDGGRALGMWQIHHYLWAEYFGWQGDPFDPVQQTTLAWQIALYDFARNDPFRQWSTRP